MKQVSYAKIRGELRTGDIVLFRGNSLVSRLIMLGSGDWSHVGMVVRQESMDAVCVWESTSLDGRDIVTDEPLAGVGLTWLSDRVKRYDGVVAVRKLRLPAMGTRGLAFRGAEIAEEDLAPIRTFLHGRPYEKSKVELLRAAYDGWGGLNSPDLSSIFCSELVAETYKRLGLLEDAQPSNEYTPHDFAGSIEGLRGDLGEVLEIVP